MMLIDSKFLKKTLKPRNPLSHKGENGRVLVVGGSKQYFGSPALAALSALRAGADLVYLLVPDYIAPTVASYSPDLIVWGYEGQYLSDNAKDLFEQLRERTDVMIIGNGITKSNDVLKSAGTLIREYQKPCVIDADAIVRDGYDVTNAVYTPHTIEFGTLSGAPVGTGLKERENAARAVAGRTYSTVLLKGPVDVISDGENVAESKTGNAGMTKGGTGDTLAGILGAFLAQKYSAFDAACMAAYVNGAAGDLAFKKYGYSLLASDLINEIPNVMVNLGIAKQK